MVNINDSAELYEVTTTLPPPSALSDYSKGLDLSGVPEIKPGVDYSCIKKELDVDESSVPTVPCTGGSLNHGCHQEQHSSPSLSEDYSKKEEWLTPTAYRGSVTRDDAPDGTLQDRTEEAILRNSESVGKPLTSSEYLTLKLRSIRQHLMRKLTSQSEAIQS